MEKSREYMCVYIAVEGCGKKEIWDLKTTTIVLGKVAEPACCRNKRAIDI